ncbi:MAG: lysophospholipid acyltransferase family protein [Planctomycetes bacterium]|nr:lysophospholipid acyltransferase family protein [Planctomycetota bacterium]
MAQKAAGITFRHYVEYAFARFMAAIFRILPLPLAAGLGRFIGWLFFTLDKRHRERVRDQVKACFGDGMTDEKATGVAREMYAHFGNMLAEFVRIPTMNESNLAEHIDWNGNDDRIRELLAEGNGLIFATGHIGNWEITGIAGKLAGFSVGAVARPLDNPLIDRYIRSIRESSGNEIWDKFGAMKKAVRTIRDNKAFGILVDQDAGQRGIFIPFFGINSSTIPTVADLALRTGAPIVTIANHRAGSPMHFRMTMRGPIRINKEADQDEERVRVLGEINSQLEEIISEEPAQWLWLHRRWKTRPKGE